MKNLFFLMIFFVTLLMSCEEDPWVPMEPSNPSIKVEVKKDTLNIGNMIVSVGDVTVNVGINKSTYVQGELIVINVVFTYVPANTWVLVDAQIWDVPGSVTSYVSDGRIFNDYLHYAYYPSSYNIGFRVKVYDKFPLGFPYADSGTLNIPFTVK